MTPKEKASRDLLDTMLGVKKEKRSKVEVVLTIIACIGLIIFQAAVISKFWYWFVSEFVGGGHISIAHAAGFQLLVFSFFITHSKERSEVTIECFIRAFAAWFFILVLGYVCSRLRGFGW